MYYWADWITLHQCWSLLKLELRSVTDSNRRFFRRGWSGRGVKLTAQFHLSTPPYVYMAWYLFEPRDNFTLLYFTLFYLTLPYLTIDIIHNLSVVLSTLFTNFSAEDRGSKVIRNVGVLPHYYRVTEPKRPRPNSAEFWFNNSSCHTHGKSIGIWNNRFVSARI
jgi:hypothetical protein